MIPNTPPHSHSLSPSFHLLLSLLRYVTEEVVVPSPSPSLITQTSPVQKRENPPFKSTKTTDRE